METYYVYILSNTNHTVFYTGLTSDIERRVWEHQNKIYATAFTKKYNITKLLYYEVFHSKDDAYYREKQLKKFNRTKKFNIISAMNPNWIDLSINFLTKN